MDERHFNISSLLTEAENDFDFNNFPILDKNQEDGEETTTTCFNSSPLKIIKKYLKGTILTIMFSLFYAPSNIPVTYVYFTDCDCLTDSNLQVVLKITTTIAALSIISIPWIIKKKLENISKMTLRYW